MKKMFGWLLAGVLAVTLCGCDFSGGGESAAESSAQESQGSDELTVNLADGIDPEYGETIKRYFTAIEKQDFEGYKAEIYPPFFEKLTEYYSKDGKTMEDVFQTVCHRFDEDGYESWKLTRISAGYYTDSRAEANGIEKDYTADFLDAYVSSGIIDDAFSEEVQKAASDLQDLQFSVFALYEGDEEECKVVSGAEILVLKTEDGTFLFG